MGESIPLQGPDLLSEGVPLAALEDEKPFAAHAGHDAVVVVRHGDDVYVIGGTCTHYGGPLAEGIVHDGTIRCPWHHACFSLHTGEALAAPALNPVAVWQTEIRNGVVYATTSKQAEPLASDRIGVSSVKADPDMDVKSIVIVGGGAAGSAAAEMLRREGYSGGITMIDPDASSPYDRPNLSKDYLAGNAPAEWIPLRPSDFYAQHDIDVRRATVDKLDTQAQKVTLATGESISYDVVLLATGASPIRLPIPGADLPHVHVLRSLADCDAIIADVTARMAGAANAEEAANWSDVVVLGASFIGMEAAASLRARNLSVTVVAPEEVPFARVLGDELGAFLKRTHESNGVHFYLGHTAREIREGEVVLDDGTVLEAGVVVMGVGVRPSLQLAIDAGLENDRGVIVNELLQTSAPNVYAVGDIARYPDARTGERVRVEHWVVAQRMGQAAARNIMGARKPFRDVPFFWTNQYDVAIAYVGHAEKWDRIVVDGSLDARDCRLEYIANGKTVAVVTLGRDHESLKAELAMEQE